ncbi:hypothetical protein ACFQ68_40135 [Amycolatopsis japonica]|uniref:hypothetical protein n=1 Tax=Amycolatopsis japonica TaxID=208439 RepID=UPI0036709394
MFGRNNNRFYRSYVDAWRAAAFADVAYAVRRNVIVLMVLAALDLLVLDGYWLVWPVRAVDVFLVWNTWGWLRFRSGLRNGRVFPPDQPEPPRPPFGGPDNGRGWRHG